jgi:threonyl-tRNA synthetase
VLTVTDAQADFARNIYERLRNSGVRVELDDRNEKLGYKIREAQMQKVPYMLVIGAKEAEAGGVSARRRDGSQLELMSPEAFAAMVGEECLQETKGRLGLGAV